MTKYKFENKGRSHIHTASRDGVEYKPLKGTTTIINEIYPPPLAWYGSAKALEKFGFITEKKEPDALKRKELLEQGLADVTLLIEGDDRLDKYADFLETCYRNHDEYKKSQGKKGTDMHGLIEDYIKKCIKENEGAPIELTEESKKDENIKPIIPFIEWSHKDVEVFLWSEAHCFSEKLWVGGIADFGFVHKNGSVIIGDAKSGIYPKYFIQTAGYGIQIKENGLFNDNGRRIYLPISKFDGYMIWNYNESTNFYRTDIEQLESDFVHTCQMYDRKDIIGINTI